jgi:hypothetical protein
VLRDYHHIADETLVRNLAAAQSWDAAFEELARPLHEALYELQTFDLLDSLSHYERLILGFDYVRMQVGQGGFIQLIQNGYVSLLVTIIESGQALGIASPVLGTLDDALRVFVLNNDALSRETTPKEFARLYEEFKEFEALDKAFMDRMPALVQQIVLHGLGA